VLVDPVDAGEDGPALVLGAGGVVAEFRARQQGEAIEEVDPRGNPGEGRRAQVAEGLVQERIVGPAGPGVVGEEGLDQRGDAGLKAIKEGLELETPLRGEQSPFQGKGRQVTPQPQEPGQASIEGGGDHEFRLELSRERRCEATRLRAGHRIVQREALGLTEHVVDEIYPFPPAAR
jgi:hypothetical protein